MNAPRLYINFSTGRLVRKRAHRIVHVAIYPNGREFVMSPATRAEWWTDHGASAGPGLRNAKASAVDNGALRVERRKVPA